MQAIKFPHTGIRHHKSRYAEMLASIFVLLAVCDPASAQTAISDAVTRLTIERSLACVDDSFSELKRCQKAAMELKAKLQPALTNAARAQLAGIPAVSSKETLDQLSALMNDLEVLGSTSSTSAQAYSSAISHLLATRAGGDNLRRSLSVALGMPSNEQQAQQLVMSKVGSLLGPEVEVALLNPEGVAKAKVNEALDKSLRSFIDSNLKGTGLTANKLESAWNDYQSLVSLAGSVNSLVSASGSETELFKSAYSALGGTKYVESGLESGAMSAAGAAATAMPVIATLAATAIMMAQADANHKEEMAALQEISKTLREVQEDVKDIKKTVARMEQKVDALRTEVRSGFETLNSRLDLLSEAVEAHFSTASEDSRRRFTSVLDETQAIQESISRMRGEARIARYEALTTQFTQQYETAILNPSKGLTLSDDSLNSSIAFFNTYWRKTAYEIDLSSAGTPIALESIKADLPVSDKAGFLAYDRLLGALPAALLSAGLTVKTVTNPAFPSQRQSQNFPAVRFGQLRLANPTEWARGANATIQLLAMNRARIPAAAQRAFLEQIATDGDTLTNSFRHIFLVQTTNPTLGGSDLDDAARYFLEIPPVSTVLESLVTSIAASHVDVAAAQQINYANYSAYADASISRKLLDAALLSPLPDTLASCDALCKGRVLDVALVLRVLKVQLKASTVSIDGNGEEHWEISSFGASLPDYKADLSISVSGRGKIGMLWSRDERIDDKFEDLLAAVAARRRDTIQFVESELRATIPTNALLRRWEGVQHVRKLVGRFQYSLAESSPASVPPVGRGPTTTADLVDVLARKGLPAILRRDSFDNEVQWGGGALLDAEGGKLPTVDVFFSDEAAPIKDISWCTIPSASLKIRRCGPVTLPTVERTVARAKGFMAALPQ